MDIKVAKICFLPNYLDGNSIMLKQYVCNYLLLIFLVTMMNRFSCTKQYKKFFLLNCNSITLIFQCLSETFVIITIIFLAQLLLTVPRTLRIGFFPRSPLTETRMSRQ